MNVLASVPKDGVCPHCRRAVDFSECEAFDEVYCADCHGEFVVPAEFGRFRLLEEVGSGKMGLVFRAWDTAMKMQVAVKIAKQDRLGGKTFYDALMAEVKSAGRVKHKHLIEIYDYGQVKGAPYVAMEFISGGTLLDRVKQQSSHTVEKRILGWAIGVAEGLQAVQRIGMIHGDLKPANLLFDRNGVIKISDFGLARVEGRVSKEVWGTPLYIAPEKVKGHAEDFRSDMYSLGVILWQLLSGGTPPYDATTATEVICEHVNAPIPDVTQVRSEVSYHSGIILRRMMAKSPQRRFNSYDYLLAELRAAHRSAPQTRVPFTP